MAGIGLSAGAARVDITPRAPCTLGGYAARDHAHEGVHDPLSLRAFYARGTDGVEVVVISADILWFGETVAREVRGALRAELGVPEANSFLVGVHTHSAPDGRNPEYLGMVAAQALAAAALARGRARPAKISVGRGQSGIGVNRRERKADGRIHLGRNPAGPIDRELIALAVDGVDGEPIARVANFACHGVVLGQENYQVSGDWPGQAARAIEGGTNEAPFLFLNGGCGNVNPRIGPQNDFGPVKDLAGEFVRDFYAAGDDPKARPREESGVSGAEMPIELPDKEKPDEKTVVALRGVRLGGIRLVGYPGEVFSETTIAVKQALAGQPVMVCSYVDASESGYVPVAEAFVEGGYEVGASKFGPGAEQKVREGLVTLAGRL